MVRVSDSGPRGLGFETRERKKSLLRIFDGCHECLALKETARSLMVRRKTTNKNIKTFAVV